MAYTRTKLKSTDDKTSPFFQTILNRKHVGQMSAYPDSATDCMQTHFY